MDAAADDRQHDAPSGARSSAGSRATSVHDRATCATRRATLGARGCERFATRRPRPLVRTSRRAPDADAAYAAEITLDLGERHPARGRARHGVKTMRPLAEIAEREGRDPQGLPALLRQRAARGPRRGGARCSRGRKVAPGVELYLAAASREVQAAAEAAATGRRCSTPERSPCRPAAAPASASARACSRPARSGISATNRNFKGRMGSRDARCLPRSPAGRRRLGRRRLHRRARTCSPVVDAEPACRRSRSRTAGAVPGEVEILDGFPAEIRGPLVFLPQDNLNTDGIYGKDYTYRELTREEMANGGHGELRPGVRGRRRGAVTSSSAGGTSAPARRASRPRPRCRPGIPMVIAGSFSQTYQRNAFNNGFLCIETRRSSTALRRQFATESPRPTGPSSRATRSSSTSRPRR